MFDAQVALHRWTIRAVSYGALLTDSYPPFDGEHPVRFEVEYPDRVSRWKLIIWKCITSIPHFIVLQFLWLAALFCMVVGWFAILFVGRFPKGLHGFVGGVLRWQTRVNAYCCFAATTNSHPFSLSDEAGPAGRDTYIVSSVIGCLLGAGLDRHDRRRGNCLAGQTVRVPVSYDDLTAGRVSSYETSVKAQGRGCLPDQRLGPRRRLLLSPDTRRRQAARRLLVRARQRERPYPQGVGLGLSP